MRLDCGSRPLGSLRLPRREPPPSITSGDYSRRASAARADALDRSGAREHEKAWKVGRGSVILASTRAARSLPQRHVAFAGSKPQIGTAARRIGLDRGAWLLAALLLARREPPPSITSGDFSRCAFAAPVLPSPLRGTEEPEGDERAIRPRCAAVLAPTSRASTHVAIAGSGLKIGLATRRTGLDRSACALACRDRSRNVSRFAWLLRETLSRCEWHGKRPTGRCPAPQRSHDRTIAPSDELS